MVNRHRRAGRRKPREYLKSFFRDIDEFPGYFAGFYGGIALVVLGVVVGLIA